YTFACIMRRGHPIKSDTVTLDEFKKYGHAVPQSRSRSHEVFEQYLKAKRIERHVTLRTEHFLSIPMIVANTDLLAIVPLGLPDNVSIGLPQAIMQANNIRVAKTTFALPKIATKMHWHRSMHRDPRNQWLRRTIIDDLRSVRRGLSRAVDDVRI
ncbi:hypothetical protein QC281_44910, partial [Streptomyces sp. DH17]|nr:hypothetical protein [Streptomyces sp. DH17]